MRRSGTNDGKRLWFPVTVRDCTEKLTLYMQEAAAFKLSGIADAEQFEAAHIERKLLSPQIADVKIIRRLKCSASQPADLPERQLDVRIVDAAPQNCCVSRTEDSFPSFSQLRHQLDRRRATCSLAHVAQVPTLHLGS